MHRGVIDARSYPGEQVMNDYEEDPILKGLNQLRQQMDDQLNQLRQHMDEQKHQMMKAIDERLRRQEEQLDRLKERITDTESMMSFVRWAGGSQGGDYRPNHPQRTPSGKNLIQRQSDWLPDHPYRR
jgi:exonuclease VII large subunit